MSKGLSCLFNLDNGKFGLTDGVSKARDGVLFTCMQDKRRIYCSYFGLKLLSLLRSLEQKPTSTIMMTSSILKTQIKGELRIYNPTIQVNDIDFGYIDNDRKHLGIELNYSAIIEGGNKVNEVIFV